MKKSLDTSVSEDEHAWFKALSAKDKLSVAAHLRRAAKDYRKRIEDAEANGDAP